MRIESHPIFQKNSFLQGRPAAEQRRIASLAMEATELLSAWAAGYGVVRPVRILPICLSVAAAAPFADLQAIIDTARVSVWIFALDDLFDELNLPEAVLLAQAEHFAAILRGRPVDTVAGELAEMLVTVKARLATYDLYDVLGSRWEAALIGTIEAMLQENEWRAQYQENGTGNLPSYEDYLQVGRKSVGGPPHMWAAILTADDASVVDHIDNLERMIADSAAVVRLANDLQTYERELREGKLNSVLILCHSEACKGLSDDSSIGAARLYVRSQIAEFLRLLAANKETAGSDTSKAELAIMRIAQYVADFYQKNDFHTAMLQPAPA